MERAMAFMTSEQERGLTEQRNSKIKRPIIITTIFLFTILIAAATAYFAVDGLDQTKQSVALSPSHKKINILVLGVNQRRNDIGRSNVTCVVTVDTDTKDVSMLWVPRDSRVKIPGYGWNKIGHAYSYGGHKLSEQTVSDLLGIPIDYYVAINMDGFKKVIDAIGGVDINVEKRMYYYDPYDEGEVDNNGLIDLKPGMQHMNGNTALEYVRFRHDEMGDIGRIERQQKFAKALLSQMATPAIITKIPDIVNEVNATISTDIPVSQMLSLGKIINDAYKRGLNTYMVSGRPVYIDGISFWLPDIAAMRQQIAEIQGIATDDNYMAATRSLANEYENAVPKETKLAEAPPALPNTPSTANKQSTTTTSKTLTTNKASTTNTKPKADPATVNDKNSAIPRVPPVPSNPSSKVPDTNNGTGQKNM